MTQDINIPPEAWKAAMSTYHKEIRRNPGGAWQAAIRAALEAWPGARNWQHCAPCNEGPHILLPLNTENPNAEA